MKTIVLLGGYGRTGQALAPLLINETDANLVIAGRHSERGRPLADFLNSKSDGSRVRIAQADASDFHSLMSVLTRADLVIVASSTAAHCETVARAAIAAGVDYLDLQYSSSKLATLYNLQPEITRANRCFITDGGFHPGIPGALVRYATLQMDRLERAVVGSVISVDWSAFDLGQETKEEFVREFIGFQSRVFRDGAWRTLGAAAMMKPEWMDFPTPFGRRACIAMSLDEMNPLPNQIPSLRETGFFIAGFNWLSDWVITPIVMAGLKFAPIRLLSTLARLQYWSMAQFARPPFGVVLKLEAAGLSNGTPRKMALTLGHPDGYLLTAVPVVACVKQWLSARMPLPGLWHQAQFVEPVAFLDDLRQMGIEVSVSNNDTIEEPFP